VAGRVLQAPLTGLAPGARPPTVRKRPPQ
jgi:hypothetical protein